MKELIQLLHEKPCTLVIKRGDEIRTYHQRGVTDLMTLLHNDPQILQEAIVADKVVGKAAAALMIKGGINQLYTDVLSKPAWDLLKEQSYIAVQFRRLVGHIENRSKTDWCPLEKLCLTKESIEDIYQTISDFMEKQKLQNNNLNTTE